MNHPRRPTHRGRAGPLLLLAGVVAAAGAALVARAQLVATTLPSPRVEPYLELPLVLLGALAAAWVTVSALLAATCVVVRRAGSAWSAGERLVLRHAPPLVRRWARIGVGVSLGAGLALGAGTAHAAVNDPADHVGPRGLVAVELGWRPAAPPPARAPHEPPAGSALVRDPSAPTRTTERVVVRRGDTLWSIAARSLPPGSTDREISAAVELWHATNSDVVGPDPDLILPGQVLSPPEDL